MSKGQGLYSLCPVRFLLGASVESCGEALTRENSPWLGVQSYSKLMRYPILGLQEI